MDANGDIPELDSDWSRLSAASSPGIFTAPLVRSGDNFTTYSLSLQGEILTDASKRVTGVINSLILTATSTYGGGQQDVQLEVTDAEIAVSRISRSQLGLFLAGDDNITGSSQSDIIRGLAGNDVLHGRRGSDLLFGDDGNDTLVGSSKDADRLYGGAGDDIFSVADARHVVFEQIGGGYDTVIASVDYVLTSTAEIEVLQTGSDTGTKPIDLTGSNTANAIMGNAGANTLSGRGGDDTIIGGNGNDTVMGGSGADQLSGGAGRDQLSYTQSTTAVVVDLGMQEGYAGHAVGDFLVDFENVIGSRHGDQITGDHLGNGLVGGRGNDLLDGADGNDTLIGSQGNDSLIGGSGFDRLDYSQDTSTRGVRVNLTLGTARDGFGGNDSVSNFEDVRGTRFNDVIVGSALDETLRGEVGNDRLQGGDGNDNLFGGAGHDTLTGAAGQDIFVFNTAPGRRTNVDKIVDFRPGEDIFHLENAVLKNIGWVSRPLRDDAFHLGKAAEDAFNRIIYDKTTGSLYYDSDGTGAASQIKIAVLTNKAALDYASFYVI
jgi:Ca2+-binding RTX toxin-like protein